MILIRQKRRLVRIKKAPYNGEKLNLFLNIFVKFVKNFTFQKRTSQLIK
jgi:hypothetical protein